MRTNGCCVGDVASCAIAVSPRSYVSCTAPVQSYIAPSGGLNVHSSLARLSGVRCDDTGAQSETYLVMSHYDGDMEETMAVLVCGGCS